MTKNAMNNLILFMCRGKGDGPAITRPHDIMDIGVKEIWKKLCPAKKLNVLESIIVTNKIIIVG